MRPERLLLNRGEMGPELAKLLSEIDALQEDITRHRPLDDYLLKQIREYFRIEEKDAGVYRRVRAFITGSKYALPLPEEVPALMRTFLEQTEKNRQEASSRYCSRPCS